MFSDRGPQPMPAAGQRKRGRSSTSLSSEGRLVPRDPSMRTRCKIGEQRVKTNTPPSKAAGIAVPGGVVVKQSAHGNAEEYLDDVRFDVAPKDMCIVGSQDFARPEDDSVVMEELCSLGSVLAGGKGEDLMTEEESADQNVDDGNSKGSRDDSSHGGCNLLTRWLQPATGSCHSNANSNSCQGTVGDGEESLDLEGLGVVGGDGVGGEAQAGIAGSTGNGSRIVGDWARRALLRKKMADAERSRKLRTQLRDDALASASKVGSDIVDVFPMNNELHSVADQDSAAEISTVPPFPRKTPENTPDSHDVNPVNHDVREGTATNAPADECIGEGVSIIGKSVGDQGNGGEDSDEYGDDFAFLTEADLQAIEDEAAKVSASQMASQRSATTIANATQDLPMNSHTRNGASTSRYGVVENKGGSPGERASMGNNSHSVKSIIHAQETTACKGSMESTSRSPFSSLGQNAKRNDNRHHPGRIASSQGVAITALAGNRGGANMMNDTASRGKRNSFQSASQEVTLLGRGQRTTGTRRICSDAGGDAESVKIDCVGDVRDHRKEPGIRRGIDVAGSLRQGAGYERTGGGDAYAGNSNPSKVLGLSSQAGNATGPKGTPKRPLFTTYGSMAEFTASTSLERVAINQAAAASGDPTGGQSLVADWAQRPQQEHKLTQNADVEMLGVRNPPVRPPGSANQASGFAPAFVHRRFLVLEVSYGRCGHGDGPGGNRSREKILIALEQLREGIPGSTANKTEDTASGAVAVGSAISQKREISLREDWFDCEVEPGEVVHVIFPMGGQSTKGGSTPVANIGARETLGSEHVILDNMSGKLLIVQPDILVSPTKVADTVLCARKAVLQSRIASDASKSKAAVLGSLKHELFETSLLAAAASARASSEGAGNPTAAAASAWQDVRRDRVKSNAFTGNPREGEHQLLSSQYMTTLVERIVLSQLEALYGAGLDDDTARRELLAVSRPILTWHRSFLADRSPSVDLTIGSLPDGSRGPSDIKSNFAMSQRAGHTPWGGSGGVSADRRGLASFGPDGVPAARVQVAHVLSTEDDVWSPVLGLKGILDATVEARVEMLVRGINGVTWGGRRGGGRGRDSGKDTMFPGSEMSQSGEADRFGGQRALVMPVEVKTGKRIGNAHSSHRAQVMLYTLLLRVRYGNEACTSGLLVYTSGEGLHTELVTPVPAEIRALVLARNRHASGMAKVGRVGLVRSGLEGVADGRQPGGSALPPVIRRPRECGMCFQLSECMLYHRAVEAGDQESSGLDAGVFDKKVGHLSETHMAFFSHWDRAIDLEAKMGEQARNSMWQESGPERESRTGKCMSGLIWLGEREYDADDVPVPGADRISTDESPTGDVTAKRFLHVFARRWAAPKLMLRKGPGTKKCVGLSSQRRSGIEAQSAVDVKSDPAADHASLRPKWARPLTDLSLAVGDMVCISSEGGVGEDLGGYVPGKDGAQAITRRPHGGHETDHCRLLTGSIAAILEDTVEVFSEKRMRVPRRGGWGSRGTGKVGTGSEAGRPLDIEDLLGHGFSGPGGRGTGGVFDAGTWDAGDETVLFRIDKDEWAAAINMMRSNLVRLMTGPSPECEAAGEVKDGGDNLGDERRRKLVVDLHPPRFARFTGLLDVRETLVGWAEVRNEAATGAGGGPGPKGTTRSKRDELEDMFRYGLNEDQRAAVRKVVTAKDYALLLGMPGTGKTWTIAFAVRVLLARGASVLITSYTHSAVDNLLLKLIGEGVPCLRIGKPASVHPGVRAHCINQDASATTTTAYAELVASARIVGCTCLGVKHPLFSQRRFDYCVVDEAGQISQPVVLAPLRCADVFVLVGDHYQLPPLVTSKEALEVGMSESLFRRLCEAHPGSLERLSYQYRMNGDVMALCNDLTYSGRLRCGNSSVEGQRLHLPNLSAIPPPHRYKPPPSTAPVPWLTQVLDPHRRVLFLDTDAITPGNRRHAAGDLFEGAENSAGSDIGGLPRTSRRDSGGIQPFSGLEFRSIGEAADYSGNGKGSVVNEVESDIVRLLVWGLDVAGFDLGEAGVISPYRSQVRLLQTVLKHAFPGLEINTIDKYQGRDKEVILVSFVRSNPEGTVGNLLRDWRRLNVALSRAKRKLLLLGSLRTLSSCAILSSLAGILKSRGWVYSLPPEAHRFYPPEFANGKFHEAVEHAAFSSQGLQRRAGANDVGGTKMRLEATGDRCTNAVDVSGHGHRHGHRRAKTAVDAGGDAPRSYTGRRAGGISGENVRIGDAVLRARGPRRSAD